MTKVLIKFEFIVPEDSNPDEFVKLLEATKPPDEFFAQDGITPRITITQEQIH